MARWQFTTKTLLLSTSFLGAGIGCLLIAIFSVFGPPHGLPLAPFLAAGPLMGAGICLPFHRARLGAYVGFFSELVLALVIAVFLAGEDWEDLWHDENFRFWAAVIGFGTASALAIGAFASWREGKKRGHH